MGRLGGMVDRGLVWAGILTVLGAFDGFAQPSIVQDPGDRAAVPGARVSFSVAAQGTTPLRYQWQFNGQDLQGATTRTLSFLATPTRAGIYSVRVSDPTGERSSSPAQLAVMPRPRIVTQPMNTVVGIHDTATFTTVLDDSGPYTRLIWHNNNPLEGPHEIPEGLGFPVDEPTLTIPNCLPTDSYNGVYWLAVTNAAAGTVSRRARLKVVGPPTFAIEPKDRTVRTGGVVVFQVRLAPDAAGAKTYQWFKERAPIDGATTTRLVLSNVQPGDAGIYACVATSIGGSTQSWGAQLNVTP